MSHAGDNKRQLGRLHSFLHFSASKFPLISSLFFLKKHKKISNPKHAGAASLLVLFFELLVTIYVIFGIAATYFLGK